MLGVPVLDPATYDYHQVEHVFIGSMYLDEILVQLLALAVPSSKIEFVSNEILMREPLDTAAGGLLFSAGHPYSPEERSMCLSVSCDEQTMPRITVVLPVFNHERYVMETLQSLFAQTYSNFEIVAVDDGSTDASLEILNRYRSQITIIEGSHRGPAAARNRAIETADS